MSTVVASEDRTTETPEPPQQPPSSSTSFHHAVWGGILATAAYLVAMGPGMKSQNADSLVPIFVSLDAWTPFYWGQNRFGMLIPLIALPIRSSFANLVFQNALSTAFLLAGAAAAFARCRVARPVVMALALVCLLLSVRAPQVVLLLFTTNQSYAPALGCFGLALYLCRRSAIFPGVASAAMMIVGAWTNGGVALFVMLLALALTAVKEMRSTAVPMLTGALLSLGAHRVLQAFQPAPLLDSTPLFIAPLGDVPAVASTFWIETYTLVGHPFWLVTGTLWILAIVTAARRPGWRSTAASLGAVFVAAAVYGMLMALFLRGSGRHMMAALPICWAAPMIVLFRSYAASGRFTGIMHSRGLALAVAVWLLLLTGLHRPSTVRRNLIAELGENDVAWKFYARGVTAVTGDYWKVWPYVFATNLLHERATGTRPVLPVAMRSEVLHARFNAVLKPHAIVNIVPSGSTGYWLSQADLPPIMIDEARGECDQARIAPGQADVRRETSQPTVRSAAAAPTGSP